MSDEKNVANLYPYQDKNKYGEDYFKWNKKDWKKLIKKTFREIAGQSNAEKSDEKELDEERKSIVQKTLTLWFSFGMFHLHVFVSESGTSIWVWTQ